MNAPLTAVMINSVLASVTNDIDALYVLDQQAKALAEQVKVMKAEIANKYGVNKSRIRDLIKGITYKHDSTMYV